MTKPQSMPGFEQDGFILTCKIPIFEAVSIIDHRLISEIVILYQIVVILSIQIATNGSFLVINMLFPWFCFIESTI